MRRLATCLFPTVFSPGWVLERRSDDNPGGAKEAKCGTEGENSVKTFSCGCTG